MAAVLHLETIVYTWYIAFAFAEHTSLHALFPICPLVIDPEYSHLETLDSISFSERTDIVLGSSQHRE